MKNWWIEVLTEAMKEELLKFPRKTKPTNATCSPILVGFSDGALQAYDGNVYDKWELEEPDDLKKIGPVEELSYIPATREDGKLVDIGSNSRKESRECWPFTRDFDANENTEKATNEEPDLDVEEIPEESSKCHKNEEIKLLMSREDLQEEVCESVCVDERIEKVEATLKKVDGKECNVDQQNNFYAAEVWEEVSSHIEKEEGVFKVVVVVDLETQNEVVNKSKVGVSDTSKLDLVVHENAEVFENMVSKVAKHLETGVDASLKVFCMNVDSTNNVVKEERVKQDLFVMDLISEFAQGGLADVPHVELSDSRPLVKCFLAFIAVEFDPGGMVKSLRQLAVPFMLIRDSREKLNVLKKKECVKEKIGLKRLVFIEAVREVKDEDNLEESFDSSFSVVKEKVGVQRLVLIEAVRESIENDDNRGETFDEVPRVITYGQEVILYTERVGPTPSSSRPGTRRTS